MVSATGISLILCFVALPVPSIGIKLGEALQPSYEQRNKTDVGAHSATRSTMQVHVFGTSPVQGGCLNSWQPCFDVTVGSQIPCMTDVDQTACTTMGSQNFVAVDLGCLGLFTGSVRLHTWRATKCPAHTAETPKVCAGAFAWSTDGNTWMPQTTGQGWVCNDDQCTYNEINSFGTYTSNSACHRVLDDQLEIPSPSQPTRVRWLGFALAMDNVEWREVVLGAGSTHDCTPCESFSTAPSCPQGCSWSGGLCAEPTPAVTCPTPGASATGDPHLTNLLGEKFDLLKRGTHTLILIPQGAKHNEALLRVDALATGGKSCEYAFISDLKISGRWVDEMNYEKNQSLPGMKHYLAMPHSLNTRMHHLVLGPVALKIVHAHTASGLGYLNIRADHLATVGVPVGGLLGIDDHSYATDKGDCLQDPEYASMEEAEEKEAGNVEVTAV